MEFLRNSSTFLEEHVFFPNTFFFFFLRLDFRRGSVPSRDRAMLNKRVVVKEEPPVNTVLPTHSRLDLKCLHRGKSPGTIVPHFLDVIGMNYCPDHIE